MTIGLVLSGGGSRCLAHIGVLKALEGRGETDAAKNNAVKTDATEISAIAACSTGAFIGALAAAGHDAAAIQDILSANLLGMISPSADSGLADQKNIAELLSKHLPERFEDLEVPLAVVAADIQTGELVVLNSGPLVPALCASNAFPGLFDAVELEGRFLVDGGILDNVPVDVVKVLTTAPVLAVDVSQPKTEHVDLDGKTGLLNRVASAVTQQVTLPVAMLRKSYIVAQSFITEIRLATHPPDVLIRPVLGDFGIFDFNDIERAVAVGYTATLAALTAEGHKLER